ncbi:5-formyltetrahydrofolate cyclo-ligase [bacterium]|jgi:5,10-methenyltetrahydrofolate synthetase|nr:5-formyltetrahydrofolate cyclo-ligase [bacterium]MBT6831937.1 5-formyltetrahydrofolate cyclo-ligase [bacterium]MBT6996633.1 5-formyltetrahydrofolate cyclo-ligase [bacterium]MBT7773053.1 5-formyltetrahydrofolate cyclo-ligase [bacterium]
MKFSGTVVSGLKIGRKFGVATANLKSDPRPELVSGVYFVRVRRGDENLCGVMHFGARPTFDQKFTIEVHLLDFSSEIYGEILEIDVLKFFRKIQKFETPEILFAQIQIDIAVARKFFLRTQTLSSWKKVSTISRKKMAETAIEKISANQDFLAAVAVFAFAPNSSEIPFVENLCKKFPEKKWSFPKIFEKKMEFFASEFSALRPGKFGILEPEISTPEKNADVIFVPAVAADFQKNRLGRGGGFYDQFLPTFSGKKICVLPKFAIVEKIPTLPHDQKVDEIIFV